MKIGICPMCPEGAPPRRLIADKCQMHYWSVKQTVGQKKYAESTRKRILDGSFNFKTKDPVVEQWFDIMIAASTWICENCGEPIPNFNRITQKAAQAHICPKAIFESVKVHLHNHLHLCSIYSNNNCHAAFDSSWDRASRMPVFQLALNRFDLFKDSIDPKEYRHLPDIFFSRLILKP